MPNGENKQGPERYLDPSFIQELRRKAVRYYIGADQYESSDGRRFPKKISEDPLFQAIAYIRRRGWAEQKIERDFAPAMDQEFERFSVRDFLASNKLNKKGLLHILEEMLGPKDHTHEELLAREFIAAVRQGGIERLRDIVQLCLIFEEKTYRRRPSQQLAERKRDPVPWEYYTAMAALWFLKRGNIPTRPEVKEAAFKERAMDELSVKLGTDREKEIAIKMEGLRTRQPNWRRIFKSLELDQLPAK